MVTIDHLRQALDHQQQNSARKLGDILTEMGAVKASDVATVLQAQ
jgi:flagellar motility protein MotE (MotC chaperone)